MLEYIIGGFLLGISILIVMFVPHRLANFAINIFGLIKPKVWYNGTYSKIVNEFKYQITNLWAAIISMVTVWFMLIYVYPFLISLIG